MKTQPRPRGNGAAIVPLVQRDLEERMALGVEKYGTPLRAHNGREALWDAYEEVLDLACYLRQEIEERRQGGDTALKFVAEGAGRWQEVEV